MNSLTGQTLTTSFTSQVEEFSSLGQTEEIDINTLKEDWIE